MKLQSHSNKLETNVLDAQTQDFGIGDASVVIEILRNRLYENKIQTLVQEYICNARDAMRECGKGNEFEVTMPTSLNPVFKVRDFGPGISPDRMANVFIKYGSSTKRDSNNQTGGFGIGAKSAWSYTDSFTITTFIDGMKRVYVAHIGVNNQGRLDHVSTSETNEKNGTEIQVPVGRYDIQEFRTAVFRAIYFWESRPALKGGEADAPTLCGGERVNQLVEVIDSKAIPGFLGLNYYDSMLAVIDGVPYPIGHKLLEKCKKLNELKHLTKKTVILHFGNGIVEVSASRESIADAPATIQGLDKLGTQGVVAIKTKIVESFQKVKSSADFIKTYSELEPYFYVDKFAKYDGYSIESGCVKSDLLKKVSITHMHKWSKNGRHPVEKITKEPYEERDKVSGIGTQHLKNIFFRRVKENSIVENKRLRANINQVLTDIILIEQMGDNSAEFEKLISDLNAKDFCSLAYVDLPKEPKAKIVREKQEFCVHQFHGERHKYLTLADNTEKWFYVPMTEGSWNCKLDSQELKELNSFLRETMDTKICGMSERVIGKVKGNANFEPLSAWIEKFTPNKKQLAYAKMMGAVNREVMELISKFKDIEDPFLNEMAKEYRVLDSSVGKKGNMEHVPDCLLKLIKETDEYKSFEKKDKELSALIKNKYSLLNAFNRYLLHNVSLDDIVVYLNAKFES